MLASDQNTKRQEKTSTESARPVAVKVEPTVATGSRTHSMPVSPVLPSEERTPLAEARPMAVKVADHRGHRQSNMLV